METYQNDILLEILNALEPHGVHYEFLTSGTSAALSISKPAEVVKKYIDSGYKVNMEVTILRRSCPKTDAERLDADSIVDRMAFDVRRAMLWDHLIIDGRIISILTIEIKSAALVTRYENGMEDHAATLNLIWEVY